MSETHQIDVMVADDHPVVREGIAALIARRADMRLVGEASDGCDAVELYRKHQPDVALIDLRMPVMDGVATIAAIRAEFPSARTIVLTTYDLDDQVFRGLRAGAKAYLLKDAPREELLDTIRRVYAGESHIPGPVAAKLARHMGRSQLTDRELEVLRLMTGGLCNHEIGAKLFITEGTVKAHVNRILTKLRANDRTHAVTIGIRIGLIEV